jgi:hypothetical protein
VIVMALGTIFAIFTPETSTRKPGALASLSPGSRYPHGSDAHLVARWPRSSARS